MNRPEICTCGHESTEHMAGLRCANCKCTRYDRRNFTDAELEQLERTELERARDRLNMVRPVPPAAPLERIADALEKIAEHLDMIARPVRAENPCTEGGPHIYQWVSETETKCTKCARSWPCTPPERPVG